VNELLTIDGSMGEGGGQVVRTSLALSIITQRPIHITRLRAGRARPGLMRQHLTAVLAAADISGAEVQGAEIGSKELSFRPGPVRPGSHCFAVGTAGSATLVLQTVLPPLLLASMPSHIVLEGGTHNPTAPPFDFLSRTYLPILSLMGPKLSARLDRYGFYPAGGGRFEVDIEPAPKLERIHLRDRGQIRATRASVILSELPEGIADREISTAVRELGLTPEAARRDLLNVGAGPGNVFSIEIESDRLTEIFTAFGRRGVRAEKVARQAIAEAKRYLDSDATVGPHLADQLLLPFALAGGGSFATLPLSPHAATQIDLLEKFLPVPIRVEHPNKRVTIVQVGPIHG
jgi:RNA 3'-terminal phosphate cyclase (ATP)